MRKGLIAVALAPVVAAPMVGATDIHFHRKPADGEIRVACVGDSITNGALIPGCFFRSYPAQLERMLGGNYHVENYGLNDRTLQSTGDKPYCNEKEYQRSLAFNPDIVIMLLGTNDTKPHNMRSVTEFADEYIKLAKTYVDLPSSPRIILCLPPWSINADNVIKGITNDTDVEAIPQIIEGIKLAADKLNLETVDLYSAFENRPDLLSYDGVHPNYRGAGVIAEKVKQKI